MSAESTSPQLELSVAARTDRGLRRDLNEDALLAADPCFLVADGMGGHERGELASRAAISAFGDHFPIPGATTTAAIEVAIAEAQARVKAVALGTKRGAGCTLTGAIRVEHEGEPYWFVLNVGDSRVYVQRQNRLQQITIDHSLREELLLSGNPEAAHTPRNIITRALGNEDDRYDGWMIPIETGSRLLICSDGLTTELSDDVINGVLAAGGRAAAVVDELLRLSLAAGGRDNISIVLVDVLAGGITMDEPQETPMGDTHTTVEVPRPTLRE